MLKKKDNKTINKSIDLLRIIILSVLFCLVIFLFTLKLFDLQILNTKKEEFVNTPKVYKTGVLETSRGHIYDRNGVTLVSNKKVYNVIVDKKTIDSSDYNTVLLSFIDLCQEHSVEIKDVLPISKDYPYTLRDDYILDDKINSLLTKFIKNFAPENHGFYTNENEFYSFLCEKYNVSEESAKQES
jgi:cell division protein FtsI/penicillin-binding protein 2